MRMFGRLRRGLFLVLMAAVLPVASCVQVSAPQAEGVRLFPANGARNVNPDTHLVLSFAAPPEIGASGKIQIFDAADNSLVDTLDMSLPPSPRPTGRSQETTEAQRRALAASTKMEDYQVDTIGGTQFHFFPIIVRGNKARIYPHHNKLAYGRTYVVKMDAAVLKPAGGMFAGFGSGSGAGSGAGAGSVNGAAWTFSTKAAPPRADAARVVVAADGSGDFNTVQGAIDFIAAKPARRANILIRNGVYEELVFMSGKADITLRGESRDKVQVSYPNNSVFNPSRGGPSRRPAFSIQNSADIQLSNFTISNSFIGQAEALLVRGERIVIDHMTLNGSGDALTTYGTIYMADSKLIGHGDTILGYAALFCLRCEIRSAGPFTWTRTPQGGHGNVFVDSTFVYLDIPLPWTVTATDTGRKSSGVLARLPNNGPAGAVGANFPHAEMVLINSRTKGVPLEGWGPVEDAPAFDSSNVRFWEFNTRDMDGRPADMSKRHRIVRELTLPKDAQTIADYSKPDFVLGGWRPVVR